MNKRNESLDDYVARKNDEELEFRLRHQLDHDMLICKRTNTMPTFLVENDYKLLLKVSRRIERNYSFFMENNYFSKKYKMAEK